MKWKFCQKIRNFEIKDTDGGLTQLPTVKSKLPKTSVIPQNQENGENGSTISFTKFRLFLRQLYSRNFDFILELERKFYLNFFPLLCGPDPPP